MEVGGKFKEAFKRGGLKQEGMEFNDFGILLFRRNIHTVFIESSRNQVRKRNKFLKTNSYRSYKTVLRRGPADSVSNLPVKLSQFVQYHLL